VRRIRAASAQAIVLDPAKPLGPADTPAMLQSDIIQKGAWRAIASVDVYNETQAWLRDVVGGEVHSVEELVAWLEANPVSDDDADPVFERRCSGLMGDA
jgi:hypothetical protein